VKFTGISPSNELRDAVALQAQKQKTYKRKHKVKTLSDFGIKSDRVKKDFGFLYIDEPFRDQRN
jgi:hypothetical protein